MKKWEIAVIVVFFAAFMILFFSVEQLGLQKTPKVGEMIIIDNGSVQIDPPIITEAGAGWKFAIFDGTIINTGEENMTFYAGRIEDEEGMRYYPNSSYNRYTKIPPNKGRIVDIAYKIPSNAVPKKFYFIIANSDTYYQYFRNHRVPNTRPST